MKKAKLLLLLFFLAVFHTYMYGQQERGIIGSNNWLSGWTNFKPLTFDYSETNKVISNKITTDYTLSNANTYLLQGKIYVTNNATLTIEPGTVIRCDTESVSALIITKGAKIVCNGTNNNPIVFTSNKAAGERKQGDWGGIVILGDAPMNTYGGSTNVKLDVDVEYRAYGGSNLQQNSGSLKNVRIEYAGKASEGYDNYNGITFAGVGSLTKLDYIQVSNCSSKSFVFLGGLITANNLVTYKSRDNDFVFTQGVQALLNNCLAIRNAFLSPSNGARCMEVSSYIIKETTDFSKKLTNVQVVNSSFINENDDGLGNQGLIGEALKINGNVNFSLKNGLISGFAQAAILGSTFEIKDENLRQVGLTNCYINNCLKNIISELGSVFDNDLEGFYANASFNNLYQKIPAVETFLDPKNPKLPDYRLKLNKVN